MDIRDAVEFVGLAVDLVGVGVIVVAIAVAGVAFARGLTRDEPFDCPTVNCDSRSVATPRRVRKLDHAALMHSWTSPPRRSRRLMSGMPSAPSTGARPSGT